MDKAVAEIASIGSQLKTANVVLNPFAHLFGDPSTPEAAVEILKQVDAGLAKKGFTVQRLSFGMFYELELKAKGHRLSRFARSIE